MPRIVSHNDDYVSLGVIDKNPQLRQDLHSVTYADVFGTLHTVYAHKGGPFQSVDDVVKAHEDGVLHPFESHDQAISFHKDRGDTQAVERLESVTGQQTDQRQDTGGRF